MKLETLSSNYEALKHEIAGLSNRVKAIENSQHDLLLRDTAEISRQTEIFNDQIKNDIQRMVPFEIPLSSKVRMKMLPVKAGTFKMGTAQRNIDRIVTETAAIEYLKESPQHTVSIRYDFYIGETEVTKAQFETFLKEKTPTNLSTPSHNGLEAKFPVTNVSWHEAMEFCQWLTSKINGYRFRLPTEADWEYAARGNDENSIYPWGSTLIDPQKANYKNPNGKPLRVKYYSSGKSKYYGAYEMAGNVYEWCFNEEYKYPSETVILQNEPITPYSTSRAVRGGSYKNNNYECRSTARHFIPARAKMPHVGFRIIMVRSNL